MRPGDESIWTATADIMDTLEANGLRGVTKVNYMALASTMRRMGCKRERRTMPDGKRLRGYLGIDTPRPKALDL